MYSSIYLLRSFESPRKTGIAVEALGVNWHNVINVRTEIGNYSFITLCLYAIVITTHVEHMFIPTSGSSS